MRDKKLYSLQRIAILVTALSLTGCASLMSSAASGLTDSISDSG
jgi:hypothetical protein